MNDLIKYGLLAVGGYWLWNWWQGQQSAAASSSTPAATPAAASSSTPVTPTSITSVNPAASTPAAPITIASVSPSSIVAPAVVTVTLSGVPSASPQFTLNGAAVVSSAVAGSGLQFQVSIPSGTNVGSAVLAVSTSTGNSSTTLQVTAPPPPAVVPTIGKYPYTDKASYLAALIGAANDAAGGGSSAVHTGDEWNWYMVNTVGVNLSPGPDTIMAALGVDRNATVTAQQYYQQMNSLGLIPYPSGLSGFGLGAALVVRVPQMARPRKVVPVPPVGVLHLPNGRQVFVRVR